jgi:hypothetical protein
MTYLESKVLKHACDSRSRLVSRSSLEDEGKRGSLGFRIGRLFDKKGDRQAPNVDRERMFSTSESGGRSDTAKEGRQNERQA